MLTVINVRKLTVKRGARHRGDLERDSGLSRDARKAGVADGTRTHDDRNHNPGLYQLSYGHH